jgi:hypothetical protein
MCVTCLFEDHDVPLLSTKHVALRTNYSTEIAYHKQSIQHNQTSKQLKCVRSTILDLLGCYDKKDRVRDHDLGDMNLRA